MGLCLEWQDITFEDTSTCFRLFLYQWFLWLSIQLFSQVWNHRKLPCCKTQAFSRRHLMAAANPVTISCVIQGLICADSLVLCEGVSAWDLSHQLDPAWSNCLLPPPPPRKLTNAPTPYPIIANQDESGLLWTTAATAGMINVPLNLKKMSWPQGRKKETVPQSKYKLTSAGSDPVLLIRTTTFPL